MSGRPTAESVTDQARKQLAVAISERDTFPDPPWMQGLQRAYEKIDGIQRILWVIAALALVQVVLLIVELVREWK
jgi:hypothetical protein